MQPAQKHTIDLVPGAWYAAALDTGPLPLSMVKGPLIETLSAPEHRFGSLQVYFDKTHLPAKVGAAVREAAGATVWITGQFLPPGYQGGKADPVRADLPEQVLAVEQLKGDEPPIGGAGPMVPVKSEAPLTTEIPTSTLVLAVTGVVVVGGGIALVAWYLMKKPKKNPRRRGRRRKK